MRSKGDLSYNSISTMAIILYDETKEEEAAEQTKEEEEETNEEEDEEAEEAPAEETEEAAVEADVSEQDAPSHQDSFGDAACKCDSAACDKYHEGRWWKYKRRCEHSQIGEGSSTLLFSKGGGKNLKKSDVLMRVS